MPNLYESQNERWKKSYTVTTDKHHETMSGPDVQAATCSMSSRRLFRKSLAVWVTGYVHKGTQVGQLPTIKGGVYLL